MIGFGAIEAGMLNARAGKMRRSGGVLLAIAVICLIPAWGDQGGVQKRASSATARAHRTAAAKKPALETSAAAPVSLAPKQPDWPANDQARNATVVWNSRGLRVDASNSSLQQILKDVATQTGAKVSGLGTDQRVFGVYGPGPARDVISQLLDGSGYNVLMIGDQGQGTPRQIILSKKPTGPAPVTANSQGQSNDDSGASPDVEEQPQPPIPPTPSPSNPNGFPPGMQPRTPQQILQEMQQRQQQIEQMQQQRQQQQQQRQNPQ